MVYSFLILILLFLPSTVFSPANTQLELIPLSVENASDIQTIELLEFGSASDIVWHPNVNTLLAANQDGVWRLNVDSLSLEPTKIVEDVVDNLAISANGEIVAGRDNTSIYLWDFNTNEQLAALAINYSDGIWLNEDGSVIVFTYQSLNRDRWQSTLHFWDVAKNIELKVIEYDSPVSAFAVSLDVSVVATGHADGSINLRNIDTGEIIYTFEHYSSAIQALSFSRDATTIALSGDSRELGIWNLYDGEYVSITRLSHLPYRSTFTSDGAILASSSVLENHVVLWDARDGLELAKLIGHSSDVVALDFNSDNTMLATSSLDGTLRLWGIKGR